MNCPDCGVEVVETSVYCQKCGYRLDGQGAAEPEPAFQAGEAPSMEAMSPGNETATERFRNAIESTRDNNKVVEEELWEGGYCGKAMMGAWIVSGAITVALLVVALVVWSSPWLWYAVLAVSVLLWGYQLVVYARRRFGVRYRLTTQRFFHEQGILVHTTDLIEVIDMDDITYSQTIIDRMFGVGTIRIVSSDRSHPDLSVPGIANVKDVAAKLHEGRHNERLRRGLHIESI